MDFLKKGLSKVKDKVSQVELEKKLAEATTNETGFANISLLNELSSRSDDSEDCKIMVKYSIKLLGLKPKFWKRILKALNLIEHVIKTGSQNFVDQIKDERDRLRELYNFSYEDEDPPEPTPSILLFHVAYFFFSSFNLKESVTKLKIYLAFSITCIINYKYN